MGFSVVERSRQVKINPLTTGKRKIITYMSSLLCARQCFGAFPHSFDSHSNPEKKVVFPLFFQGRLSEASGVSKLREEEVELRWGMKLRLPANLLAWDCGVIPRPWEKIEKGWRVSCLVQGAYLYHCPGNCTCNSFPWSSAFCNLVGGLSCVPL